MSDKGFMRSKVTIGILLICLFSINTVYSQLYLPPIPFKLDTLADLNHLINRQIISPYYFSLANDLLHKHGLIQSTQCRSLQRKLHEDLKNKSDDVLHRLELVSFFRLSKDPTGTDVSSNVCWKIFKKKLNDPSFDQWIAAHYFCVLVNIYPKESIDIINSDLEIKNYFKSYALNVANLHVAYGAFGNPPLMIIINRNKLLHNLTYLNEDLQPYVQHIRQSPIRVID